MTTEQTYTGLEFNVAHGAGTVPDKIVVDSERVLIGSGPHCEIRLPPDQAAVEHVLITFQNGAIYAHARSSQPPPLLNGAPFTETPLTEGAQLRIGPAEITVSIVEIADAVKAVDEKSKDRINPATLALAAVAVPISLFVLFDDPGTRIGEAQPAEVPALWSDSTPKCSHQAREQALAVARDKRLLALGRRERSPFDVRDGVLAVPLFHMAHDCYLVAGEAEAAAEMEEAATRLKEQMEESYRAHQMRLEHSLDVQNLRVAQEETQVLLRMLEGQTGPYMIWLSNLDRELEVKLGKQKK
jgi:hypothetical protein